MNLDKAALHMDLVSQSLTAQKLWAAKLVNGVISVKAKLVFCDTEPRFISRLYALLASLTVLKDDTF